MILGDRTSWLLWGWPEGQRVPSIASVLGPRLPFWQAGQVPEVLDRDFLGRGNAGGLTHLLPLSPRACQGSGKCSPPGGLAGRDRQQGQEYTDVKSAGPWGNVTREAA